MDIRIYPPEEMLDAHVELPLSKSISNRALIMNALTPGAQPLTDVARCDDTQAMLDALSLARPGTPAQVNVGLAGTAMRFLTAYFAATEGIDVLLDGNERMRQRPIGPLVEALRCCGASIEYAEAEGFPPLRIRGAKLAGGTVEMDATVSSQFVSALLMVAPTCAMPLTLTLKGEIASLPYLKMTVEMMRQRGINAELYRGVVNVEPGHYLPSSTPIERDWSAASYWYEVTAATAGWVTLDGMERHSLQGDSRAIEFFEKLGVLTEWEDGNACLSPSPDLYSRLELDLSDNPDLAQTIAVTSCFLFVPFRLTGLQSLKIKETDRLAALQKELAKLSFVLEVNRDSELVWDGKRVPVRSVEPIDTYGDHRMAMAFAPMAVFAPGLVIRNAEVVSKSYPDYWQHLREAGFTIEEID